MVSILIGLSHILKGLADHGMDFLSYEFLSFEALLSIPGDAPGLLVLWPFGARAPSGKARAPARWSSVTISWMSPDPLVYKGYTAEVCCPGATAIPHVKR